MRRQSLGAAVAAAVLFAAPAAADWLVTRDGGKVETRGAWKVKGKTVVFTRADGQLASLRIADVDWAASERATAEAAAPPPAEEKAPPEPKKEPRWVLTDSNFRPSPPPPKPEEEKPAEAETDAVGRPRVPVALETWERRDHPDGLEIAGSLRNPGNEIAAEVGVTVQLYDEEGSLLATSEGRIATPSIAPGATAAFRASFPGVFTFAEAKFDVRGVGLRLKAAPEEEAPPVQSPPP